MKTKNNNFGVFSRACSFNGSRTQRHSNSLPRRVSCTCMMNGVRCECVFFRALGLWKHFRLLLLVALLLRVYNSTYMSREIFDYSIFFWTDLPLPRSIKSTARERTKKSTWRAETVYISLHLYLLVNSFSFDFFPSCVCECMLVFFSPLFFDSQTLTAHYTSCMWHLNNSFSLFFLHHFHSTVAGERDRSNVVSVWTRFTRPLPIIFSSWP